MVVLGVGDTRQAEVTDLEKRGVGEVNTRRQSARGVNGNAGDHQQTHSGERKLGDSIFNWSGQKHLCCVCFEFESV